MLTTTLLLAKNIDVISGDVQGVSIHYAGFEGDDIFLVVMMMSLTMVLERMQEFLILL